MRIHKESIEDFPRFSIIDKNIFSDKTCYFATGNNLKYVVGYMNSSIGRYLLKRTVSILDNGGYLMQKIYLDNILIPRISGRDRRNIEHLVEAQLNRSNVTHEEINTVFYSLLGLQSDEILYIENDNAEPVSRG